MLFTTVLSGDGDGPMVVGDASLITLFLVKFYVD